MRQIRLIIKTGGGDPATGAPEGIHWHMNIGNKIDYVAAMRSARSFPTFTWKICRAGSRSTTLKTPLSARPDCKIFPHHMDCVDCHNRPTHIYVPPDQSVDQSLLAHRLDITSPSSSKKRNGSHWHLCDTDEAMHGLPAAYKVFTRASTPTRPGTNSWKFATP